MNSRIFFIARSSKDLCDIFEARKTQLDTVLGEGESGGNDYFEGDALMNHSQPNFSMMCARNMGGVQVGF